MKILVTGGAGYIGSQLIRDLGSDPRFHGARVTIYDSMRDERYQSLMDLPASGRYDFHAGEVEDARELARAAHDADVIIHLAALTNAVISFGRVQETYDTNLLGTRNVVDAAAASPATRRVVYASTCSVYGETPEVVNEDSPCHPESPYAMSKLDGEKLVQGLAERTGGRVRGTSLRLATVFGQSPGLRVHTVVNLFALHAALGMPLIVKGTGEQKRPFIHVRDASAAFTFVLSDERTLDGVYNVVGENASVRDVLGYVRPRFPKLKVTHEPGRHLNQISYQVDGSRLRGLGWAPTLSVEDGIEEFARHCIPFSSFAAGAAAGG